MSVVIVGALPAWTHTGRFARFEVVSEGWIEAMCVMGNVPYVLR